MTVEEAVRDRLLDDADVTALVGSRVYQLILPQKPTLPAVRVQLIDEPETSHLRGHDDLRRARVQVDCYANVASSSDPYLTAAQVAEKVNAALRPEPFSIESPGGARVVHVDRLMRRVMYEGEELRIVRVFQDYAVWFKPQG